MSGCMSNQGEYAALCVRRKLSPVKKQDNSWRYIFNTRDAFFIFSEDIFSGFNLFASIFSLLKFISNPGFNSIDPDGFAADNPEQPNGDGIPDNSNGTDNPEQSANPDSTINPDCPNCLLILLYRVGLCYWFCLNRIFHFHLASLLHYFLLNSPILLILQSFLI